MMSEIAQRQRSAMQQTQTLMICVREQMLRIKTRSILSPVHMLCRFAAR